LRKLSLRFLHLCPSLMKVLEKSVSATRLTRQKGGGEVHAFQHRDTTGM
jgi:hypothetical protein